MSWTYSSFLRRGAATLLLFLLNGIGGSVVGQSVGSDASLALSWRPVDSLHAALPPDVRVYAAQNDSLPLRAWYVRIDSLRAVGATDVVVSDERDGVETVSRFAADATACVAVNGGYYDPNTDPIRPAGLVVRSGTIHTPPTDTVHRKDRAYPVARAALGLMTVGAVEVVWTSRSDGQLLEWSRPPGHLPDNPAPFPSRSRAQPWSVRAAVGAGPALVAAGTTFVASDEEVFFGTGIPNVHPRTAAGVTADGSLILMVVDGRQSESRGVDLVELAQLMRQVGAVEALNLDGGGSSTLVVNGRLVNRPTGGTTQREVATALVTDCGQIPQ